MITDTQDPLHENTAADASQGDVVGRDVLEIRCRMLEQSVRASGHVTAAQIDAVRPGGAENPDPSAMGWLHFLCNLHRMHERGPAAVSTTGAVRWDARAMEDVRAAMHNEPIPLKLTMDGTWAVYPKSEYALHRCALIEVVLRWVATTRVALADVPTTTETIELTRLLIDLQARMDGELAWIVTTPGCDVPWPDGAGWEPEIPPVFRTLDVLDTIQIWRAHLDVNLTRINMIAQRTHTLSQGGEAMPLPAFLGVMSSELKVQPSDLARKWSLGELFAQAFMKWESNERAKRDAKRDADANPKHA